MNTDNKLKIAVGVPCNRTVKAKTTEALLRLVDFSKDKYDFFFTFPSEGYTIAENRLYIAIQALKRKCSHLLFIDDDMVFEPNTLDRLLSHQKDIVGVVYHSRQLEDNTTVVLEDGTILKKDFPQELMKCKHVGAGVMLVDLSILKELDEPWFKFATYPNGSTLIGEDSWFCSQARKKGFEVWCDPTLSVGHIGDFSY